MILSSSLDFLKTRTVKENIRLLKETGFDAYDFTMCSFNESEGWIVDRDDYIEYAKEIRAYADGLGIKCNQSHAPCPSHRKGEDEWNSKIFKRLTRSIEISAIVGAKVCVVHPCNDWNAKQNAQKVYFPLISTLEKTGVKVGVENMWNCKYENGVFYATEAACSCKEDFSEHLKLLPKEHFVACLDIGHAEMFGGRTSAKEMILTLKDRLGALHVHDNDLRHDRHTAPFCGNIAWETVISALKEVEYSGDLTFEARCFAAEMPESVSKKALELLHDIGRYLIDRLSE